jgi:D-glycero-alpha-D-manno-heptose-7-phosphate kinase
MVITQTPLRISFVGGGTDFPDFYSKAGGCVLSSAIDKYVYVIVKERFDEKIYINYSQKEIVDSVAEIQHGLVREAMRKTGVEQGVEITTLADIPSEGCGLGSSSSITVGLLNALYSYQGKLVTAETLASEACEIEIDILGSPIGKQDQYIAAYGNTHLFHFNPDGKVIVEKIELPEEKRRRFCSNLLLFYTNSTRSSATILSQQKKNIDRRMDVLTNMRDQVGEFKRCLTNFDFNRAGEILHRGWMEKKKLTDNISNGRIDELYEKALAAGAIGGKISGAGGGGFLLLYCPMEKQDRLREALSDLRELPFHFERDGSKVIFNVKRYEWK